MTFEEAKIKLKRGRFWLWSKILAIVIVLVNIIVYLFVHFRHGHWHNFTIQDVSEIKIIKILELDYNFPWWTNIIFSLLWLSFYLGVFWYLRLDKYKLKQRKLDVGKYQGTLLAETEKELDQQLFIRDAYQFSLNFGSPIIGLVIAFYFRGALYGLVANIIFDLYFHVFMVAMILIWSFISPLYEIILKRPRKR